MPDNSTPQLHKLYRVVAPHFVAGVLARDGLVLRAAPILSWARGWTMVRLEKYCQRKHWKVEAIDDRRQG